jgi:hypothetical protein
MFCFKTTVLSLGAFLFFEDVNRCDSQIQIVADPGSERMVAIDM